MPEELCHCGKPLHYQSAASEKLVRQLVADHGPMVRVTVGDRTWLVQRHYIALHGINAWELPDLGFEEIQREVAG